MTELIANGHTKSRVAILTASILQKCRHMFRPDAQ